MKFMMDERVKHRLTGLVVVVSIAVIFLPVMMKKSNQHFEENVSVSLKLPTKPTPPKVAMPTKSVMFESVKVAHVDLSTGVNAPQQLVIAKAEPISMPSSELAKREPALKSVITAAVLPKKVTVVAPALAPKKEVAAVISAQGKYAVQLASFSQQSNAQSLVNRLRKEGYVATYNKSGSKNGQVFKVVVGQVNQKLEAASLQKKLASNMQLNGFVIQTGLG